MSLQHIKLVRDVIPKDIKLKALQKNKPFLPDNDTRIFYHVFYKFGNIKLVDFIEHFDQKLNNWNPIEKQMLLDYLLKY